MEENIKPNFLQVAKHPIVYAMLVVVSLLWFIAYMFKDSSNQVNVNCEAEKVELRKENAQYKADKDALTTALLVKNGIILQQAQEQKELDSTIRKTVGKKAKEILKEK